MSMIFDTFPTMEKADAFVAAVHERYGVDGQTFESNEDAQVHDPFPWVLREYIAHVDRAAAEVEDSIVAMVVGFDGVFAGT